MQEASQLRTALTQRYNFAFPESAVSDAPTLSSLAGFIREQQSRVTRPAAEAKAFERENFTYYIDWQAASKQKRLGERSLSLGVRVACDSAILALAPTSSSAASAATGIQLLQGFLGNAPESVEVTGLRTHTSPGHSTAGHERWGDPQFLTDQTSLLLCDWLRINGRPPVQAGGLCGDGRARQGRRG